MSKQHSDFRPTVYQLHRFSRGVNTLHTLGGSFGSFPFPSSQHLPSFPVPLSPPPFNPAGERCEFPERVLAEPGRQTHFGAFWGKIKAFQGTADLLYCLSCKFSHRYRLVLRRHQPHNQLLWQMCCTRDSVGVIGGPTHWRSPQVKLLRVPDPCDPCGVDAYAVLPRVMEWWTYIHSGRHFLFTSSDTFAVGCIVQPQHRARNRTAKISRVE